MPVVCAKNPLLAYRAQITSISSPYARLFMNTLVRLFGRKARFSVALLFIALVIIGLSAGRNTSSVMAAPLTSYVPAKAAPLLAYPSAYATNQEDENGRKAAKETSEWGEITVAQPKIWQYERVNALLDGLLRDVEGVSLADLVQLNPSAQNAAAIQFVQSALGISVQYDQAAQVNARNILQTWQAKHDVEVRQLDEYNSYMQGLTAQRDGLTRQLFATNSQILALQTQRDQGSFSAEQANQLQAATDRAAALNAQLKDINSMISSTGAAPTLTAAPTPAGTSATAPALPNQPALGDLLKGLPDSLQKALGNALQSPSYPATKQLDNFITLLHERLVREISVMQDDLIRDPDTLAYLVQFDVGLYPSHKNRNQMAKVAFGLKDCPRCKVYSLYPGQSSYNVANYQGASKRRTFAGNIASLIGLGISANYQRQEDALKGNLVQSVYVSGFQDDLEQGPSKGITQRFGWYYNAAPFDEYVTPGIRSTFAIVTIPKEFVKRIKLERTKKENEANPASDQSCTAPFPLTFTVGASWAKRDRPLQPEQESKNSKDITISLPGTESLIEIPTSVTNDKQRLHVLRMEYEPVKYPKAIGPITATQSAAGQPATPAAKMPGSGTARPSYSGSGCNKGECVTVLLTLDVPVDPNLVITVNGTPLHRVRDWRGRATSVLPPVQSLSDLATTPSGGAAPKTETVPSRSLLESDQIEPDSWFAVTAHDLLLNISHEVAGETIFPVIQISDPAKRTLVLPNDIRQNVTEIITEGFRFLPATEGRVAGYTRLAFGGNACPEQKKDNAGQGGPYPYSTFVPLFTPNPPAEKFYAFVGQTGEDLIIGFLDPGAENAEPGMYHSFTETRTTVVLEDPDIDLAWSLDCYIQGKELVCKMPMDAIRQSYVDVVKACENSTSCPSIEPQISAVRFSIKVASAPIDPEDFKKKSSADIARLMERAFVPRLQVWVEQYDPAGKNSFASLEPTKLGLFPLSRDFTQQGRPFESWRFYDLGTTADEVALEECNYFAGPVQVFEWNGHECNRGTIEPGAKSEVRVRYLTPFEFQIIPSSQCLPLQQLPVEPKACRFVKVPTWTLQRDEVVLEMTSGDPLSDEDKRLHWTAALAASRLRPEFGTPRVSGSAENGWTLLIPVSRVLCSDALEEGTKLRENKIVVEWWDGESNQLKPKEACGQWLTAQSTHRLLLKMKVPKEALLNLPDELHLVRTSNQLKVTVATLRNVRAFILPGRLKLEALGDGEFALRGRNAGVIEYVAVANGAVNKIYKAGQGVDVAIVSTAEKKKAAQQNSQGTPIQQQSSRRSATGTGGTPTRGSGGQATDEVDVLPAGSYALAPLIKMGDGSYLPIQATDEQGKGLTLTIVAKKDGDQNKPAEPDEVVTITKTAKPKTGPAPTTPPVPR